MANLGNKDGIFTVRFRYQGKEYKKSLKTRSEDAEMLGKFRTGEVLN